MEGSLPDQATQRQLDEARQYRCARRPSLSASWSETALVNHQQDNDDSSVGIRAQASNASTDHSLGEATPARPIPSRRTGSTKAPEAPLPPPPPARPVQQAHMQPSERPRRISTPKPVALTGPDPADPNGGNYATPEQLFAARRARTITMRTARYPDAGGPRHSLDAPRTQIAGSGRAIYSHSHAASDLGSVRSYPLPVHTSRIHRVSTTTLPMGGAVISAPPTDNTLVVEPTAPPMPDQPTFAIDSSSSSGAFNSNSSSSSGLSSLARVPSDEPMFTSESVTPPDEVRKVAIRDARDHFGAKMFSDKVLNFRDIGVSVIKTGLRLHQTQAKAENEGPMPGVVFRSAELGSAGEHDVKTLFSRYGIRTIIDLRSELEARASDILMKHYPSSIEPTADQSMEKLMKLRAAQVRKTIVEVAAHDYASSARPWERTGESQTSWSHRNSLRYTKSIGDPRNDPLARALTHLYDRESDSEASETQQVSLTTPYVPQCQPAATGINLPTYPLPEATSGRAAPQPLALQPSASDGRDSDTAVHATRNGPAYYNEGTNSASGAVHFKTPSPPPQHPKFSHETADGDDGRTEEPGAQQPQPTIAQSALDWGSETLQYLRSYWDQQWTSFDTSAKAEPPSTPLPPAPDTEGKYTDEQNSGHSALASHISGNSKGQGGSDSGNDSDDSGDSDSDASSSDTDDGFDPAAGIPAGREVTTYGLRRVSRIGRTSAPSPFMFDGARHSFGEMGEDNADNEIPRGMGSRATTEPIAPPGGEYSRAGAHGRPARRAPRPVSRNPDVIRTIPAGMGISKFSVENRFDGKRRRYRCNVIGENYRKKCVWANTPWSTRIKVILRFAMFNKAEAIRTIGREVLAPRGLAGSYEDYVDYCKEEFASVLRIFADPCAYPILFHCQHGKDRTGIVAMLLLGILGVDDEIIAEDYAQSQKNLEPVRSRMELLDMGAVGLPPSFCDSPAPVMRNLLRHIRKNYGSIRGYLRSAGLREQEINTIAWCLRGNFCGIVDAKSRLAHTEARRLYLRPSAARSDMFDSPVLGNSSSNGAAAGSSNGRVSMEHFGAAAV